MRAFERFERMHGERFLAAGRDDQARRDQRIGRLELADQRQIDRMPAAGRLDIETLAEAVAHAAR